MLIGIIILLIGALYLLEAIIPGFALDFEVIWPIILMAIAIGNFIKRKKLDPFMIVLFFIGGWYFCYNVGWLDQKYNNIFWPLLLILLGITIIMNTVYFKKKITHRLGKGEARVYNGIFSGIEEKLTEKDFKGATIYAIFGGVELDLRTVAIKGDSAVIDVYSIFGGTTLFVPENYNVVINSNAIFGGNDNKSNNTFEEGRTTLYINCISVFGGTEIK